MKFDPLTKQVYTDKGEFVKTMHCPFKMSWDKLAPINSTLRKCSNCDFLIVDTAVLADDDILKIVRQNPDTCLKINLNQHNIKILSNGILEQK